MMNTQWRDFLLSQPAIVGDAGAVVFPGSETAARICPISQLAVLVIAGKDAATLLQGQLTCNVYELTEQRAVFAAMCNAKGRVITTFLLMKRVDCFLMVLPQVLLETVRKKLQMYVLRSVVTIVDGSEQWCLLGLFTNQVGQHVNFNMQFDAAIDAIRIQWPSVSVDRLLVLVPADRVISLWQQCVQSGYQVCGASQWSYADLRIGLPWLSTESSEQFIPQMLNIDQLGGISFNKGCYTGQEIVARTHYLGTVKRALFVAECDTQILPDVNALIFNDNASNFDTAQSVGTTVAAQCIQNKCIVQIVLQLDAKTAPLVLADQTPLTLLS